ncbi:response regulator [Segetibacter aerophilus]|uniref:Response regulator n=1 Tax=Segetibacter aerophilus TaxID=670293 RepID=A0A512BAT3_9BACT|nr:response regulator [Segetibacter aerophilus]GEO09084.1 response regulator [Segetibacter aerophilus]
MQTIIKQPSPSILIVEDDEDDIFILKEGFDDIDFKSITFYTSAATASDYLNSIEEEFLPTIIVTDFNLPAVDGFEFVKFLKGNEKLSKIPVVVLTTSMSAINKKLFSNEGVAQVILKPNAFDEYKKVAEVLINLAQQSLSSK